MARRMLPLPPLVVYHNDPGEAAAVRLEYRGAVKASILDVVPPEVQLCWSKGKFYPTIADWTLFRTGVVRVGGLEKLSDAGRQWLFRDESPQTEVEKASGQLPGIVRAPGVPGGIFSASELAALFTAQVLPAQLEHSTRRGYWSSWQQVLTWGSAHGIMHKLLPMGLEDVQALVMELMMVGLAASSIKNILSCIESRHRMFGLAPPLLQGKMFVWMCKAVASVTGTPSRLRFPIGTHHILQMLAQSGISRLEQRAMLIMSVGTVACPRVAEAAQIQMCDLLWGHDAVYRASLRNALAIRITRRKQDSNRFGLYCRVPAGQLVEMLRAYVAAMGLLVHPRCTKAVHRGTRCSFCDPVWPHTVVGRT